MRTTIDIPDVLARKAKRLAAARNTTLGALIEESLRERLGETADSVPPPRRGIRWVTVDGGLPAGLDMSNREALRRWLSENPA
ncbi:MAG: DUF2191 domain-containing protein [Proteobacteria bacterium]|jgi:hypothetical protein|nr:DUF2191 domain-containing protein [Pseudomonadota bacterium]